MHQCFRGLCRKISDILVELMTYTYVLMTYPLTSMTYKTLLIEDLS